MSTRNTAIFDLDGTLLNSLQDLTNSVNYCSQILNMKYIHITSVELH